jgi:serine/threonine protein kinase
LLDKDFNVKIVDFGLASPNDGSGMLNSFVGTPGYLAPEMLLRQPYHGHVVDLFTLGIILFNLYTGVAPFACAI